MALNYLEIGVNLAIFIFYLAIIIISIEIKRRLNKEVGRSLIYLILGVLFLVICRVQQIFFYSEIFNWILYYEDYLRLIFAIFLFVAVFSFYRALKKAGSSRTRISGSLQNYKRNIGRKIIR